MFDKEMMFRDGLTDLTADEAGTYAAYPVAGVPMNLRVIVPQLAEANDTIVVTITLSEDGTNAEMTCTCRTITKANVDLGITEYNYPVPMKYAKIKVGLDITDADSGGDFNAGKVRVGLVPAGRYDKP
jgi:hypothetical protein